MTFNEIAEALQAIEEKFGKSITIYEIRYACSPRGRNIRIYVDYKSFDYYSWDIDKKTLDFVPFK